MSPMAGMRPRLRPTPSPVLRMVFLLSLLVGSAAVAGVPPALAAEALPTWTGSISLYRDGVFTTQQSWLWCTAADVQIARNIVHGERDHTASGQRRYFDWMRARNRYDLPLSAGVDPDGWTAGMREFVDDRYRLVASDTFDAALRLAVKRLRLTGLPVALAVSHGNHGWLLTGFAASADPATTDEYETTSVRVVGPLYGLQSKNGYDTPPNTRLTTAQLRRYFTPWWYAPMRMTWDGQFISIQPVPLDPPATMDLPPADVPPPSASGPSAAPSVAVAPVPSPGASPSSTDLAPPTHPLGAEAFGSAGPFTASSAPDAIPSSDAGPPALLAVLVALSAVVAALAARLVRRRTARATTPRS